MSVGAPPPPLAGIEPPDRRGQAPIVDRRGDYARTTPQTAADRARTQAFIDAKIETVRRDPTLGEAEKAAAIVALEAHRQDGPRLPAPRDRTATTSRGDP